MSYPRIKVGGETPRVKVAAPRVPRGFPRGPSGELERVKASRIHPLIRMHLRNWIRLCLDVPIERRVIHLDGDGSASGAVIGHLIALACPCAAEESTPKVSQRHRVYSLSRVIQPARRCLPRPSPYSLLCVRLHEAGERGRVRGLHSFEARTSLRALVPRADGCPGLRSRSDALKRRAEIELLRPRLLSQAASSAPASLVSS